MKTLVIVLLALAQMRVVYEDPAHDLSIKGNDITEWNATTNDKGDIPFSIAGSPVIIASANQGLTISAPKMNGTIATIRQPKAPTQTFIQMLHVEGGTTTTFNGADAYAGDVAKAKRLKQPVPPEPKETSNATLKTERFDYSGTEAAGTFTLPVAFNLTSATNGVVPPKKQGDPLKNFVQNMTADGTSGKVDLNPASKDKKNFLKTGHIEGPIKFHIDRSESAAGAPLASVGKLDGEADQLDFDLATTRTITLSGHVKLNGDLPALAGFYGCDVAVIKLNEAGEVVEVRMTGKPTISRVKEKKAGGQR